MTAICLPKQIPNDGICSREATWLRRYAFGTAVTETWDENAIYRTKLMPYFEESSGVIASGLFFKVQSINLYQIMLLSMTHGTVL
jgi:hypothetical protein